MSGGDGRMMRAWMRDYGERDPPYEARRGPWPGNAAATNDPGPSYRVGHRLARILRGIPALELGRRIDESLAAGDWYGAVLMGREWERRFAPPEGGSDGR
jgi:hypothetical protein